MVKHKVFGFCFSFCSVLHVWMEAKKKKNNTQDVIRVASFRAEQAKEVKK